MGWCARCSCPCSITPNAILCFDVARRAAQERQSGLQVTLRFRCWSVLFLASGDARASGTAAHCSVVLLPVHMCRLLYRDARPWAADASKRSNAACRAGFASPGWGHCVRTATDLPLLPHYSAVRPWRGCNSSCSVLYRRLSLGGAAPLAVPVALAWVAVTLPSPTMALLPPRATPQRQPCPYTTCPFIRIHHIEGCADDDGPWLLLALVYLFFFLCRCRRVVPVAPLSASCASLLCWPPATRRTSYTTRYRRRARARRRRR